MGFEQTKCDQTEIKLTMTGEVLSHGLPLDKAIDITQSFGIHYFELWAQNCVPISGDVHPRLFKDRDIYHTKYLFKEASIQIACVAFGGAFHQEIVQDEKLYIRELIRSIEIAVELGAEYVNHYCNLIGLQSDIDFDILDRYFIKALKRAEELGVILVLENEAHDMTHTPENVLQIIQHYNSDYFKANLDATNFYQAGIEDFPHAYDILKPAIKYVHIKNGCIFNPSAGHTQAWAGGMMSGHFARKQIYYTLPDEGAVNILGLIKKLQSDQYSGYLTLEPHSSLENVLGYYQSAIPFIRNLGIRL